MKSSRLGMLGASLAAAAGALGSLGQSVVTADASSAEFRKVLERQGATRKLALEKDRRAQQEIVRSMLAARGHSGFGRASWLRVLPKSVWTNASYQRAARKKRNVERNRRAHRR